MEAHTGSFSKAIVDKCRARGSSSPTNFIHVSRRPEFRLPLRSQNDKLVNFRFLKLVSVQQKGIQLVNSLPTKTQAGLDTSETEPQQTHDSKIVHVKLKLQKECMFGEKFHVVGSDPMFGLWDPSNAIPMTWSDGNIWTIELDVPVGKTIQFKFILKGEGEGEGDGDENEIMWQPGSDRILKTWETKNTITVCEDWDNAELQKIIEEDPFSHQNEMPEINSEMPIIAELWTHPEGEMVSSVKTGSDVEGSKKFLAEKPVTLPQIGETAPMAIVAENIRHSNDSVVNANQIAWNMKRVAHPNRESTNAKNKDVLVAENIIANNNIAAPVNNLESTVIEGDLFNYEGGPVLVPGLASSVISTEEEAPHEVEERIVKDISVGVFEAKDHNMPELDKEQQSDDSTPQETSKMLNNEEGLFDNEFKERSHLAKTEEQPKSEPADIQWGRKTLQMFLANLGLL
ncbi:Phosphoglucan, water dikinase, chloroplastic [Quillaja saponaria]|uniref:Phosphoglucan, water dikinase, chloroplastic n=1 Tax=Quillaja saponaria TaxID=32244 RepID=A0AAD7P530_QUISA|nr:Phosphoglucan, water dikinase, chloroplastic [Quillaja saponaria]